MARGTIDVLLVSAKGLENTDFLNNMDPYVILACHTHEQKSSVASGGKGSDPEWNENFVFSVSDGMEEITLKLMDSDAFNEDDFLGQTTVSLEPLFSEGSLPPTTYSVVKDQEYYEEIRVGLTFTPEVNCDRSHEADEGFGGWKESAY